MFSKSLNKGKKKTPGTFLDVIQQCGEKSYYLHSKHGKGLIHAKEDRYNQAMPLVLRKLLIWGDNPS